jgi:Uri superfamily endonuclease
MTPAIATAEGKAVISASKGTYALILQLPVQSRIAVGRLGAFLFPAGFYIYVGSAFGPGGLRARIAHHMKRATRPHWHIDYLRRVCEVEEIWYVEGKRLECAWADRLSSAAGLSIPAPGFGCSDCRCRAHLVRLAEADAERSVTMAANKAAVHC